MNFVEYNPNTLEVVCFGEGAAETLEAIINDGAPIITLNDLPSDFAIHLYDVDIAKKELVKAPVARPDPNLPIVPDPRSLIMPVSRRQFFQKAAIDGYITREDALAAVQTGFIPPPFQDFIDRITDPDEKFNATMLFSGASEFFRQHHLTELFGIAFGLTAEQVDTFWAEAARL